MPTIVPCLLCGHFQYKPYKTDHGAELVRCQACGFIYVNPQPTDSELERIYAGYYEADAEPLAHALGFRESVFAAGIDALRLVAKPGRLLDGGCGTGGFIALAQRAGWQAVGVELSERAVLFARGQGLDVRQGTLADQRFPPGHFDVVTLWDVLEHVPHPQREIAEIHRILRPGGVLAIRVPNTRFQLIKAFYRERLRRHPPGTSLQADLHLSHFTPRTLRLLLESRGLSVFKEEAGVSETEVIGGGAPLWLKQSYCRFAQGLARLTTIQLGPSLVQYASKGTAGCR